MTGINLIYAMEGIDEGYIQEARQHQRSAPTWMKGVSIAACFLCVLLIGVFSLTKLVDNPQEVPPAPAAPGENTPVAQDTTIDIPEDIPIDIIDRLKAFPDGYQETCKRTDLVVMDQDGAVINENLWNDFYEKVQNGESAEIVVAYFTMEGDPILNYVRYDGASYYHVYDNSRDMYGADPHYISQAFSYLQSFTNGQSDMFVLSNAPLEDLVAYEEYCRSQPEPYPVTLLCIAKKHTPEETAEIFSPYRIDGDTILYGNTEWGMYTDDIYEKEILDHNLWNYNTEDKDIVSPEYPFSEHPEVKSVSYGFNWMGDYLEFGLYSTTIRYDATQISFDVLYEHRVEQFGSPATKEENRAIWLTSDGTELYLAGDDRIISEQLTCTDTVYPHGLMDIDVEAYLEDLQAPNGHFGWTYQQHVSQGLLFPENGTEEWITNEDGSSSFYFHSTIELGDHTVPIDYYFGPTLTTDEYVLKQVFVIPPEDIPHQDWIDSISDSWIRKLQENVSGRFVSPVLLSGILTDEEKQLMNELGATKSSEDEVSVFLWPLVSYFYDDGVWQYNGTGAALYLTTPRP